ncbi:hypothetical protein AXF14_05945 [Actinomyces radicidentis]|uniref:Type I restriction modification DNA specificity domain-containing protein n=1 Tax=Actinomyces radicidentis TaxID=111015 RepID=A0A120KL37_ACTRD|nr:restriction endonuclease subunit S [Actinomyces radicidentis]AMD87211.1 hypothetical protein AXF14_05945 [Actinomyces radicidentis]
MKVDWVPIGAVMSVARRSVTVDPDESYVEVGVRSFGKGVFLKSPVDGASLGNKKIYRIEPGDLVVSNIFAWEGAIGIAGADCDGTVGSHRFITLRPNDGAGVVPRYVSHYLLSEQGLEAIRRASPGSAGRNRTLSLKALDRIAIPLPTLADQRRIADQLDAVVAAQTRVAGSGRSLDLVGVTESLLDMIWGSCPTIALSSILTPSMDVVDVVDDEVYPMVGVKSHGRGAFHSGSLSGGSTRYTRLRRLTHGQVIYPKLMAWGGAFDVLGPEFEGDYVSPEFVTFDLRCDDVSLAYLRALLQSERWRRIAEDASRGTNVNRRRLHPDGFLALEVPLPTSDQVLKINRVLALARNSDEASRKVVEVGSMLISTSRNEVFSQLTR